MPGIGAKTAPIESRVTIGMAEVLAIFWVDEAKLFVSALAI